MRALIADDEALAREALRTLLAAEPDVGIVGECDDGRSTIASVEALRPDVVFLDIQMPEATGFEVVHTLGIDAVPALVFVTAYDQHALEAFHVHAIDYLLKPVAADRFAVAIRRVRSLLGAGAASPERAVERTRLASLIDGVHHATRGPATHRLIVRADGRTLFLRHEDIDRIQAEGNYARVVVRGRGVLVRESLADLEFQLDPAQFFRVHRSTILNVDRVREIQPMFKGEHVVITTDGGRFSLSRKYRAALEAHVGKRI